MTDGLEIRREQIKWRRKYLNKKNKNYEGTMKKSKKTKTVRALSDQVSDGQIVTTTGTIHVNYT